MRHVDSATANIDTKYPLSRVGRAVVAVFTANKVPTETEDLETAEAWPRICVVAVDEKRFGGFINDTFKNTIVTVLDCIEEDAMEYSVNVPDDFSHTHSFYASTSSNDTHTEILDLLANVNNGRDDTHHEERATYGIKCSAGELAYRNSCLNLKEYMPTSRSYIGMRNRAVYSYGNCHPRVGPRGSDINYWTAHSVAKLIEGHCTRSCCDNQLKTSGYSPKNSSHRKICLSRKS
ncbi:hypothetical protein FPOAC1_006966 [Fusarium poae]|uniref:hypothetical protein n=1 Tax=Fusarium poae TaxID=36050 RepID=UPI001CE9AFF0|nr:hypothetical protein FPOAC1_006966 [Fusarium poae]KAG8673652.1 hypothetical protein FPOAC1_006966 [Fusarium poae]